MNIIDQLIEYEDVLQGEGSCGNNMDFYLSSEKRLKYKFNALDPDYFNNNEFYKCFDEQTLKILKPEAWNKLSKMTYDDMYKIVESNNWDWIGDDFEDMTDYLSFIEKHDKTVRFATNIDKAEDYLEIYAINI